jgi:hypothetical protein
MRLRAEGGSGEHGLYLLRNQNLAVLGARIEDYVRTTNGLEQGPAIHRHVVPRTSENVLKSWKRGEYGNVWFAVEFDCLQRKCFVRAGDSNAFLVRGARRVQCGIDCVERGLKEQPIERGAHGRVGAGRNECVFEFVCWFHGSSNLVPGVTDQLRVVVPDGRVLTGCTTVPKTLPATPDVVLDESQV